MKKKIFSLGFIALLIALPFAVKAATSFDGMQSGNVIKLTEDVTLSKTHEINEGESLTIDLNGHTLTGPTNDYLVDNKGTVKIIDTGSNKGKISCPSNTSSCLRNLGTMEIDGITVESAFAAVKNDGTGSEDQKGEHYGNLTVKNSTIISTRVGNSQTVGYTGAIQNWGFAEISNTTILAEKEYGVFVRSDNFVSSNTIIKDSNINAAYAIYNEKLGAVTTTQNVTVSNTEITGKISKLSGVDYTFSGDITIHTNHNFINHVILNASEEGTNVIIDVDCTSTLVIPDNVTVTIAEGKSLTVGSGGVKIGNGKLVLDGELKNANVYVEATNSYWTNLRYAINSVPLDSKDINVKLLADTNEISSISISRKEINIDLNGHTINSTKGISIANNSDITINDTSKDQTGKVNTTITNSGKLTIKGGTYQTIPTTNAGATTTVEGGTFPKEILDQVTVNENQTVTTNEDGTVTIAYKKADYDKVEEAIDKANKLNKNDYKNFSLVEDAINKVDWNKNITEQKEVDKYAEDILKAIDSLELKDKEDIKDEATNPKTSDSIILVAVIGGIAVIVAVTAFIVLKKKA